MLSNSFMSSIMNMKADIYEQQYSQDKNSGMVNRQWSYAKTIQCKVEPIKVGGSSTRSDNKVFKGGPEAEYTEKLQLRIKCNELLSKRARVQNIKSAANEQIFVEIDRYDQPDTIFEVTSSHAVLDPFGKITYYEAVLQRVQVQDNDPTGN